MPQTRQKKKKTPMPWQQVPGWEDEYEIDDSSSNCQSGKKTTIMPWEPVPGWEDEYEYDDSRSNRQSKSSSSAPWSSSKERDGSDTKGGRSKKSKLKSDDDSNKDVSDYNGEPLMTSAIPEGTRARTASYSPSVVGTGYPLSRNSSAGSSSREARRRERSSAPEPGSHGIGSQFWSGFATRQEGGSNRSGSGSGSQSRHSQERMEAEEEIEDPRHYDKSKKARDSTGRG
jgi:hypothetical protein